MNPSPVSPSPQDSLVVIPAYNESRNIARIVILASQFLPVLVVDDGSKDDTAALAGQAGAQVIRQIPNQGKGAALVAGFKYAIQHGYRAVITLDADGQHDPLEIPGFLTEFEQHPAGLIIGQRDFKQMPFRRRLPNSLGKAFFSWAVGQEILDNQSGYRLVRSDLMEVMTGVPERGFEFEVAMIVETLKRGLGLGWVPIRTIYAGEKSHIQPFHHLVNFIRVAQAAMKRMQEYKSH